MSMNQHAIADKQVIPAQLIFFIVASLFGFSGDLLPGEFKLILYKLADLMVIEKEKTPAEIQDKLNHKDKDCPVSDFICALLPNQKQRNSHEKVKSCPNRTKHPVGRIERGLIQRFIPSGYGIHGKYSGKGSNGKRKYKRYDKL